MNELLFAESDTVWEHIAPHLDDALGELNEGDRDALLLRYFERKSAREMAETLGTSEDAAQKRVSRAVERLREFFAKRDITVGASGLVVVFTANAVRAAPSGLTAVITTAATLAGTTIAMTTLQKTLIATTLLAAVGTGIYEARQNSTFRTQIQTLEERQVDQIRQLTVERDDATRQVAALREENERLNRNTSELPKLRSEVARLRNESRQIVQGKTRDADNPTAIAAQAWLDRVKLLKQRFEQWPGKKCPELQFLNEQDWLNEVANRELDSETACREAMSRLRYSAKQKVAVEVNEALEQFAKSNNDQLPSEVSQLMPYVKPATASFLEGYEIAKPGWVHPPQPSSPNSERAETWAIVEKGSFTPDGTPNRDGSILADPDYDMYVVIYRGGSYGYGK